MVVVAIRPLLKRAEREREREGKRGMVDTGGELIREDIEFN